MKVLLFITMWGICSIFVLNQRISKLNDSGSTFPLGLALIWLVYGGLWLSLGPSKNHGFWGTFGASNGCESNKNRVYRYTEKTSRNVLGIGRVLSLTSTSTYVWRNVQYFSGSDHFEESSFTVPMWGVPIPFYLGTIINLQSWTALSSQLLGCSWKWS